MKSIRSILFAVMPMWLSACAVMPGGQRAMPSVPSTWMAAHMPGDEIDSVSLWQVGDGRPLVVATAKRGNRLVLLDADEGRFVGEYGGYGTAPGQFSGVNGIAIDGDLAFVVDRDNRRVQVLDLASRQALGSFGESVLRRPFGLWLLAHGDDAFHVYVTDSYDIDAGHIHVDGSDGRVKSFAVRIGASGVVAELERAFGEPEGEAALRYVESIWGDPANNRLLVADEYPGHRDIKVFDLAGRYTGQVLGRDVFVGEPEGIALVECVDGGGYWLVSDQHAEQQAFRLFDRHDLSPVAAFRSDDARMVDGIWFQPGRTGRFPGGVVFSQHNDTSVVAFDWQAITAALALPAGCGSTADDRSARR